MSRRARTYPINTVYKVLEAIIISYMKPLRWWEKGIRPADVINSVHTMDMKIGELNIKDDDMYNVRKDIETNFYVQLSKFNSNCTLGEIVDEIAAEEVVVDPQAKKITKTILDMIGEVSNLDVKSMKRLTIPLETIPYKHCITTRDLINMINTKFKCKLHYVSIDWNPSKRNIGDEDTLKDLINHVISVKVIEGIIKK